MGSNAFGQTVLAARMQELLRNSQLAQFDSGASSLLINSFHQPVLQADLGETITRSANNAFTVKLLPATITVLRNSALPYDWNLGAMIPAKGNQLHASAGIQIAWKNGLQLQLAPEWIVAENKDFETSSQELNPKIWRDRFRYYYNITDIPEKRSGNGYNRFYPGQSSISYSKNSLTYSVSTKSKWWGPGYRNALVMSSNAPGFLHLSAATNKALRTAWGNVEGEIIAGVLASSGERPPRSYTAFEGQFVYPEKNSEQRYITGLTVAWQPRWINGLFVGFAKASYLYPSDMTSPLDALPLQGFLGNKLTKAERNGTKASLGSIFVRFVLPREKAEVYLEYGRKDAALMPWNIISPRAYRRGYVAGLRKLIPLNGKNEAIQLGAELTQLQAASTVQIMEPESWYTHNHVLQGYTHMGKSLGAGIGPGSNAQTFNIAWIKGPKQIGLVFERLKHNADFYYAAFTYIGDYRRHWINLSTTLKADWDFKYFSIHGSLGFIRSLNHQWIFIEADPTNYFSAGNDYMNTTTQLSVRYRF